MYSLVYSGGNSVDRASITSSDLRGGLPRVPQRLKLEGLLLRRRKRDSMYTQRKYLLGV